MGWVVIVVRARPPHNKFLLNLDASSVVQASRLHMPG
jgi:hypothetical protein